MIQSASVAITGGSTGYIGSRILGRVLAIKCDGAANAAYTIVITGETSAIPVLTAAAVTKDAVVWFHPRAFASKNTDGVAATDAFVAIPLFNERLKIVTSVAASGTITFTLFYETDD